MVLFWEKNWITKYSCQIVYFLRHAWWIIWWIMNTFIMDEMISCDFPMLEWFCYGKKEARSLYQFIILYFILFLSSWSQYTITVTFGKESECWRFVFVFLFCCGITIKLFCSSDYILIIFKILLIYPITCLTFSAFTLLCFVYKTWYFNLNESIFGNSIFCIFDSTSDIC